MKIAVLGSGMVGRALAGGLHNLGHDVAMGTRDPAVTPARPEVAEWLDAHPAVGVASYADAAQAADLLINATNGSGALEALTLAGEQNLTGKILVDVSNPLDFSAGFPPTLSVKDTDSLGEQIQRTFPRSRVVKTLNTMNADLMIHPIEATSVFVSGNDAEAKAVVTELLVGLGHGDVIDLGDISTARGTEMYLPLWLRLMGALGTAQFNIRVVR